MKKLLLIAALFITACVAPLDQIAAVEQTIIIKYRVPVADAAAPALLAELGRLARTPNPVFVRKMSERAFVYRFAFSSSLNLAQALSLLMQSRNIESAESDILVKTQ